MDGFILIGLAVVVVINILLVFVYASRVRKVGPNEVLIISGRENATRVVTGGRAFVWPVLERVDTLSLELISIPIQLRHIKTKDDGTATITSAAQVKIGSDQMSIRVASIQLLSKTTAEIKQIAQEILIGNFKMIVGIVTTDLVETDWEWLSHKVQEVASESLAAMGLEIVSLVIQDTETRAK